MDNSETFSSRLTLLVELVFDNQMHACWVWGLSAPSQLRRYLREQGMPSAEVLTRIRAQGFSVDWLLSGFGGMFVDDISGVELRELIEGRIAMKRVEPAAIARYRALVEKADDSRGDNGETGSVESVGVGGIGLIEGKPAEAASKKPVKAVKPARS
ncbi:MAG TPA: hypothetical protein VK147_03745 [Candidatus Didemnitutus sp.]|nr:hypothetical protein [Candidatus Didemnitutus sp.]